MDAKKTTVTEKPVKQPLFHIIKRAPIAWYEAWLIRAIAIVAAFVLMALVSIVLVGENPFKIFATIFSGAFGYAGRIWTLFYSTAILLLIALALTPAFKMHFWNIGAEGQVLFGGLCAILCMVALGKTSLPNFVVLIIMLAAALLGGILWAVIPALFKAQWGTNETLFTLMMNYVAICLVSFVIQAMFPKGTGTMGIVNPDNNLGWLPTIGNGRGRNYILSIVIIALITVIMYVYLKYSKHGYEISVVGESEKTAKYIGINVKKVIIRTMALSGALCGLVGYLLVSGYNHSISTDAVGGRGFTAIMVAWLAKFNPAVMFFASFLICFLQTGAAQVANDFQIDKAYGDILTGIILFFIIGCEFFINYQICFRKKQKEA